ncbi:pyridoxal biosynthesis protein PDX1.3 [Pyrus ussuriensis x Pyrus communis]|uniref:Pyridoxal biosynthesis protein PDX1.3 n=1 Tax=Pyrus ussuriensis x Pyrus communis TaxID=2448454 RepID=A0A5N5GC64_9ROSA|nr:pyridoxal biosynthesis protein PDX1.3 [Pyrus ussuriensis x Pyrus communis]
MELRDCLGGLGLFGWVVGVEMEEERVAVEWWVEGTIWMGCRRGNGGRKGGGGVVKDGSGEEEVGGI